MASPHVAAFLAASLDGFIARRDGGLDWLDAVQAEGEDYGFREFLAGVDTLLLGRATWEVARRFDPWPYAGKRVVVLSGAPREGRHGEVFTGGEPAAVLGRLGLEGARQVYVDGGATVSSFLRAGLLDALTLSLVPVVLGEGIRLFQGPLPEAPLSLASSRAYPSGLVQLRYVRPARSPGHGP